MLTPTGQPQPVGKNGQEAEDLWTYVSSKRNRRTRRIPSKTASLISQQRSGLVPHKNDTAAMVSLKVSEIKADHQRFSRQWEDSSCCRTVKELVGTRPHPAISLAVCLGNGTFDSDHCAVENSRSAHLQLAAFTTVVECLNAEKDHPIRTVFQEPRFTSADKNFLLSLGHEIVETPAGFDMISNDCLLFGIHLYLDHITQAMDKSIPAVFIGTAADVWDK